MNAFNLLKQTKVLWSLFIVVLILTAGFGIVMAVWDFGIIDEMYDAARIRAHLGGMTQTQKSVHAVMTATLDVAYPMAYGALFAGLALRHFKTLGPWLYLPGLLVIPVDFVEGFAQIMLLTGHENFMALKLIATPVKLILLITGLTIALAALLRAGFMAYHSR